MQTEKVTTDLLCVGGGIAGLMAAIRAAECGADVVIAEKGATRYSGSARVGNDHFWCYIPEVHGPDVDAFIKECAFTQLGKIISTLGHGRIRTWLQKSFDIVRLWEEWGIPMKHGGKWEFSGHSFPGRVMTHLKYQGRNQKPILTDQAVKRGVKIMDRLMVVELLGGVDGVTGALAIGAREDRLVEFRAKSVFLGTGAFGRIYPNVTPALIGNNTRPFTVSGDGRAMAYRVGAELFDMEMLGRHAGIKNYCRSGQGTWPGVCRDPQGMAVGKYVSKPDRRYSDIIIEVDKQVFERYQQSGRGPIYMDCTGIADEDLEYMVHGLENEGNLGLLAHLKEEGIDLRRHRVEFTTYELRSLGQIRMNERAETSVKGLFCAGEESTFGISGAAVFGWIGGENAQAFARGASSSDLGKEKERIEEKKNLVDTLQNRKHAADWMDANLALQQTMADYAGLVRSEAMLRAGLFHLRRLREKLPRTLMARNRWELTRCFEVANLYDLGELLFLGALERKESRGLHHRVDYPYTDPLLNNRAVVIKSVQGKPVTEWVDVTH